MKKDTPILDLMVADKMADLLVEGSNPDRDRTRVLALIKVLPKYIEMIMSEKKLVKKSVKKEK